MPVTLGRLLKIRRLLEDSSRAELERRVVFAARIERARERDKAAILRSREQALAAIIEEDNSVQEQADRRTLEWSDAENAAARRQQLRTMADAAENRVIEAQVAFLSRRTERRQLESVLDAELERQKREQERRAQRLLDDWFSGKQVRQRGNPRHNKSQS